MGGARWWAIIGCGTLACIADHAQADELWAVQQGRLYTVDTDTRTATLVGDSGLQIGGLAFDSSGTLYGVDAGSDRLVRISTTDGSATTVGDIGQGIAFSMGFGYDATTDTLVASGRGAGLSSLLLSIDAGDGSGTPIADTLTEAIVGMDVDPSGQLWAIDGALDVEQLVRIDKASGATTVVSAGGLADFPGIGGLEITPAGDFWAINLHDTGLELVRIDPVTGMGTSHGDISGFGAMLGVTGLAAIPAPGSAAVLALGSLATLRRRREIARS